jgi:ABC-type nickel/cobalt efflux system permease component RcnA
MAFLLGALHVLEPAHGRSIVHALIVGSRGSRSDVLRFGAAVVFSHLGVAAVLAAAAWFIGEHVGGVLAPIFKVAGAVITLAIGALMLTCGVGQHTTCMHKHRGIEQQPDPAHEEAHAAHMLQAHITSPTVLGVTGGLIPCQGTIALITYALGAGNLKEAVPLLLAFAAGLGACLVAVGMVTVASKTKAGAVSERLGHSRALALAPGALVAVMGLVALVFSIQEFGGPAH